MKPHTNHYEERKIDNKLKITVKKETMISDLGFSYPIVGIKINEL